MNKPYIIVEEVQDGICGISEHLEEGIRHIGKAMQYADDLMSSEFMCERQGSRRGYDDRKEEDIERWSPEELMAGQRMGYRESAEPYESHMAERYHEPYMAERGRMGYRRDPMSGYRMSQREIMQERRGRSASTGRYTRM